jgi:hypothetical protein
MGAPDPAAAMDRLLDAIEAAASGPTAARGNGGPAR